MILVFRHPLQCMVDEVDEVHPRRGQSNTNFVVVLSTIINKDSTSNSATMDEPRGRGPLSSEKALKVRSLLQSYYRPDDGQGDGDIGDVQCKNDDSSSSNTSTSSPSSRYETRMGI